MKGILCVAIDPADADRLRRLIAGNSANGKRLSDASCISTFSRNQGSCRTFYAYCSSRCIEQSRWR